MAAQDDVLDQDPGEGADGAVERVAETVLPTRHGPFRVLGYRDQDGMAHVALVRGGPTDDTAGLDTTPLVRVRFECLTGDALGSYRCDCGEQLDAALAAVATEGRGAVIYVRGHEGRGIGILEKLRAYGLQDDGVDTVDANPAKEQALRELGIDLLERTPLLVPARAESTAYLRTKRERMGHDRPVPPADEQPATGTVPGSEWAALLRGSVPRSGAELTRRYGPLVAAGALLTVAQLGQSLDGFIASRTGDAEFVTGPEDRKHLHRLRALVDAVLVGVGTACSDDCRLTVRDVPGPSPVRVLLDPSARAPRTCQLLTDGAARTLWLVGPTAGVGLSAGLPDHVEVVALPDDGDADPEQLLRLLHERGLTRVLVEGGGRVVSAFIAAGVLDRLLVTTAPVLIGDGVPGVRFEGQDALAGALRGPVRRFTLGEDVCTEIELSTTTDH